MVDNTLTLALEGEVQLNEFASTIQRLWALVDLLSRELAEEIPISWIIDDLHAGSAMATVAGFAQDEEPVLKVVDAYGKIGNSLQRHEPIPFSPSITRAAINITNILDNNITSIRFETAKTDSIIYSSIDTISESKEPRVSFGAVKGKVESMSTRRTMRFTLYDSVFDKSVSCYLKQDQKDLMTEIWGKTITVFGRVTREPESGRAVSIRDITNIDFTADPEPGSYKIARGTFHWSDGDEPAEISVRRLRDVEN